MMGLYASPRCVTVLRLTNIPEPPEWGERSVCLFDLKEGVDEQAVLAALSSFGAIETCELRKSPAIVRFATREAALAAVAAGAEQLCLGIGRLYNTRPYERRGWCVSRASRHPGTRDPHLPPYSEYRPHAESNSAKIILGTRGELGLGSAGHVPKMIDVAKDVLEKQPVYLTRAPTPDEIKAQLEETVEGSEELAITFIGKGDKEKVSAHDDAPLTPGGTPRRLLTGPLPPPQVTDMYVSFYLSVVFEERARQRMCEQRAAADRRKRRIRLVAFGGGLVFVLASVAAVVAGFLNPKSTLERMIPIVASTGFWGLFAMLLAVLHTDENLVRGLCVCLGFLLLSCGWLFWWLAERKLHPLTAADPWEIAIGSAVAINFSLASAALLSTTTWRDAFAGLPPRRSTRADPQALAAKVCLSRLWLVVRLCAGVGAVLFASVFLSVFFWPGFVGSVAVLLPAIALNPDVRCSIQARLGRLGASSGSDEAQLAALAELTGGGKKALDRAEAAFRLLAFDKLTGAAELPGGGEAGGAGDALRGRAVSASLGAEFSVFVSHSWHDSREGKWAALQQWAESDTAERGTAPLLWLDAACAAPEDAGALELLPLLVSGCQRFLILAGSTYASRCGGGGRDSARARSTLHAPRLRH